MHTLGPDRCMRLVRGGAVVLPETGGFVPTQMTLSDSGSQEPEPKVLWILFQDPGRAWPEIVDFRGLNGPVLPENALEKVGGFDAIQRVLR